MRWLNWEIMFRINKYTHSLMCVYNVYVICVCMIPVHACGYVHFNGLLSLFTLYLCWHRISLLLSACCVCQATRHVRFQIFAITSSYETQRPRLQICATMFALCMFYLVKFKSSFWDIKHFIHWAISLGYTCTIAKINNGQYLLFMPDF